MTDNPLIRQIESLLTCEPVGAELRAIFPDDFLEALKNAQDSPASSDQSLRQVLKFRIYTRFSRSGVLITYDQMLEQAKALSDDNVYRTGNKRLVFLKRTSDYEVYAQTKWDNYQNRRLKGEVI